MALARNMEVIVKDLGKLSQVDITPSSPLFVAANKIYDMVTKKKNVRKGKDSFVKSELETLEKYEVKLEENQSEEIDESEPEIGKEEKLEGVEKVKRGKRKLY